MDDQIFDLLIIGAGSSGTSIAYEATKRGLKVAIVEAGDIGGGTSSRSTKLLHGGVRYLELAFKTCDIGQLNLVKEALLERSYWLQKAPFLTRRLELALPTKTYLNQAYYRLGLGLYDTLSGRKNIGSSRFIGKNELYKSLPSLKGDLAGGVAFSDGQFNDARLNLLLALTVERAGGTLRTHCKIVKFEREAEGKLCGAITEDRNGEQRRWQAKAIINATGIHTDAIRRMADSSIQEKTITSRGVHLVLKQDLCPAKIGLLAPSTDDGRVLFFLPFFGHTLVGTTDTKCDISMANIPSQSEKAYLISYVNRWFPSLKSPSISSFWAGSRSLLKPPEKELNSSALIREHQIEVLPCGLISAMGGKWTTCRPMALEALKAVEKILEKNLPPSNGLKLIGTEETPIKTTKSLFNQKLMLKDLIPDYELRDKQISHLLGNYGVEALKIIENKSPEAIKPLSKVIPICEAEIEYAIRNEYVFSANDLLARRCRLAMVDLEEAKRILPFINMLLEKAGKSSDDLNLEITK